VKALKVMLQGVLLASRKSVMGVLIGSKPVILLGWITAGVMAIAAALMFVPI
jgi:hypothetical protein